MILLFLTMSTPLYFSFNFLRTCFLLTNTMLANIKHNTDNMAFQMSNP